MGTVERNHQRTLRVVWIALTLLLLGAVGIAVGAVVSASDSEGESNSSDSVAVRSAGESESPKPKPENAKDSAEGQPARADRPVASPSAPAGASAASEVTTFACKTDAGVNAAGCGTVYDEGGLRVEANCSATGLVALATVSGAVMTAEIMDAEDESFGSITDSTPGRGFTLTSEDEPASSGTVTFTPPGSDRVTVLDFSATFEPGAPQGDCVFVGRITS